MPRFGHPTLAVRHGSVRILGDGRGLVATESKPALFLFQNMEHSCIHSAAGFGPLEAGKTTQDLNKVYSVEASLEAWPACIRADLAWGFGAVLRNLQKCGRFDASQIRGYTYAYPGAMTE